MDFQPKRKIEKRHWACDLKNTATRRTNFISTRWMISEAILTNRHLSLRRELKKMKITLNLNSMVTTSLMMSSAFLMGNTTGAVALSLWLPESTTCFCVNKSFWRQWRWKLRLPRMLLFSGPSLMRLCRKCPKIKTSYFNPWAGVQPWWEPIRRSSAVPHQVLWISFQGPQKQKSQ